MRHWFLHPARWSGIALLVLAQITAAAPAGPDLSEQRALWNQPAAPFRAIGNIYYVGTHGLSAWLIQTPKGLILLDGGLPESAPLIERNIGTLGFSISDVRLLLNSHAHFDHSGGLAELKRASGAKLMASEGDRESLESGTYLGSEDIAAFTAPPVKVDEVIRDGESVNLGGVALTALVTPGHTRGCTSWTMLVTDGGVPHKVIFYCSTSVAANRLEPVPQYPGIVTDYQRTFARLSGIGADVFLANHAEFFDLWGKRERLKAGAANPFIDPSELPTFVAKSKAAFEQERAKQQAAAH